MGWLSDLLYPDNKLRRRRVEELNHDLDGLKHEWELLHGQYESQVLALGPILEQVLGGLGFSSVEDLNRAVSQQLEGQALEDWAELQKHLDLSNRIQEIISGVTSLAAISSAAGIGLLVLLGAITTSTGGLALGVLVDVLLIVSVAALLVGVVEGAMERTRLRSLIPDFLDRRRKAKLAVERLRVLIHWNPMLLALLQQVDLSAPPDQILSALKKAFEPALEVARTNYQQVTLEGVDQILAKTDIDRGSWTNEDHLG